MKNKITIVVLIIIIIVLGFLLFIKRNTNTIVPIENPNAVNPFVNNTVQNNEYVTYTNPTFKYQFSYKKNRSLGINDTKEVYINDGDCNNSECALLYKISAKDSVKDLNELKTLIIKDLGANLSACSTSKPEWSSNLKINNRPTIQLNYYPCAGSNDHTLKTIFGVLDDYNKSAYVISFVGMYGAEYKDDLKIEFDNLIASFRFSSEESPVSENDVTNQFAYLKSIYTKDGKNYIDVDYIQVVNKYDVPNGVKINENPKVRTFEVSKDVFIKVNGSVGMYLFNFKNDNPVITFDQFMKTISDKDIKDDFIRIDVRNNIVTSIFEPYQQ